jgi:hypothetical protein
MPQVIFINEKGGMAVVEIEPNICAVIEILDAGEINQGDALSGDFKTLGRRTIRNQDTFDDINVMVQNTMLSQDNAIKRAMLV